MTPLCRHGYSEPHIARDFTDPKDPLENRVDDCGNPVLGSGIPYICPGPQPWLFFEFDSGVDSDGFRWDE